MRLNRREAAAYVKRTWGYRCSYAWLSKLAVVGGGPPFVKIGRTPVYETEHLDGWIKSRMSALRLSTSQPAQ